MFMGVHVCVRELGEVVEYCNIWLLCECLKHYKITTSDLRDNRCGE